mmetsp:Transcript_47926/g.114084  ORF Transcript_47926/g.114084 Transcript_47926/m.114084 type:complete len:235 (-) Transcript_47926:1705-2409(-)
MISRRVRDDPRFTANWSQLRIVTVQEHHRHGAKAFVRRARHPALMIDVPQQLRRDHRPLVDLDHVCRPQPPLQGGRRERGRVGGLGRGHDPNPKRRVDGLRPDEVRSTTSRSTVESGADTVDPVDKMGDGAYDPGLARPGGARNQSTQWGNGLARQTALQRGQHAHNCDALLRVRLHQVSPGPRARREIHRSPPSVSVFSVQPGKPRTCLRRRNYGRRGTASDPAIVITAKPPH